METAKRFAIFALLGPPLAHFVAFAMWLASMAAVEGAPLIPTQLPLLLEYTMWSLWFAYLFGIIPSLLIGGLDFLLRKNRLRIGWTTLAGASSR